MKYQDEIIEIIKNNINITEKIDDIELNTPLLNIGVGSLSFVRFIIEIEKQFDIEFPEDKLVITECGTIEKLCHTIIDIKRESQEETNM